MHDLNFRAACGPLQRFISEITFMLRVFFVWCYPQLRKDKVMQERFEKTYAPVIWRKEGC